MGQLTLPSSGIIYVDTSVAIYKELPGQQIRSLPNYS